MRSFLLPLLLLAPLSLAQAPQLLVKNPDNPAEKPHPITLAKADVHLLIAGQLCQTTMTLTFSNDANRVLEGELQFPLPENATVSGYALNVGEELVDAVTIEKGKARAVFETEVRKGIDPGLIEQVQGNNFRTRVYPIPAKGTRTIRVQYVSQPTSKNNEALYTLPLQWPGSTPDVSVRVESISDAAPRIANIDGLKFTSEGNRHVAQARFEKASFAGDLIAALPIAINPTAIVEQRTTSTVSAENFDPKFAAQFTKTEHFFLISEQPEIPKELRTPMPVKPARIAIAWDASLSRGNVDHAKEFAFIKQHLAPLGDVIVEVIPFRNVPEAAKTFWLKNGDSAEVLQYLATIPYDGGTNLSIVPFTKETANNARRRETLPAIAYYLLFTDGLPNLGADQPAGVEVPIHALSNDPRSSHALLRNLATTSGGQYINLQTLTPDQAQQTLSDSPYTLMSISADPKEVTDIYPRLPQVVQGRVAIAGKLLAKSATVTLNYGRYGKVTRSIPVTLTQDGAADANLISRFWAQLKISDLSASLDRNADQITALGKQFNLVTPYTSMIVLETVEQYLLHKIVPPKTRAGVYAEFMKRIEAQQQATQTEEKAKIDRVVAMWNNRLAWWNQDFKYAADFKYRSEEKGKIGGAVAAADSRRAEDAPGRASAGGLPPGANTPTNGQPHPSSPTAAPAVNAPESDSTISSGRHPTPGGAHPVARAGEAAASEQSRGFVGGIRADSRDALNRLDDGIGARNIERSILSLNEDQRLAKDGKEGEHLPAQAIIGLKAWTPDTPYLKALAAAPAEQAYSIYLKERKPYESSPAYYLDCADFFAKTAPDLALRILTNIPELALEDGRLLRIAAHRLQQMGHLDVAIDLFEKVIKLRPEEPQSFRDLALALVDRAEAHPEFPSATSDYDRAVELLHKVVMNHWDRFDEIEVIALTEANRILGHYMLGNHKMQRHNPFDPRLVKSLDPDLRIIMTWDTDNTDIDLHVTEPTGETCIYSHNRTTIGGALSKDFTQGYGPEEYLLKKLMPGQYKIQAHFYGNRDQKLIGPTTVQATIYTHYGRPDEKKQSITLRLKDAKDMVDIGTVTLGEEK